MKPQSPKLVRSLFILLLAVCATTPRAACQTQPNLELRFSAGQPILNLTGETGTVYSIQYATGLSSTNTWVNGTLLQVQGASNVWTDPSTNAAGQRFYRAVSVAAPSD